jgi:NAD(P)-dependent dehydrogenase (short-subunit alcohol dehydrogenase family)
MRCVPTGGANLRVAMVTGASGAIGQAIAEALAGVPGFQIILVCRDEARAKRTQRSIVGAVPSASVRYEIADLSRRAEIAALAARVSGPLHVLVNNAAIAPRRREETPEGIERQFACNVLGYFWMTRELSPRLAAAAPARVVNVASYWAGDLELDDLEFERRPYDNNSAYRQSKQCNRMLTVAFAERLRDKRISVHACHPGDVNSTLSKSLGFGGHESAADAAETPVWLASDETLEAVTGRYFASKREARCSFASDASGIEALYAACEGYA